VGEVLRSGAATAEVMAQRMSPAGGARASPAAARLVCLAVAVILPLAKAVQLAWFEGRLVERQLLLVAVGLAAVAVTVRPWRRAVLDWQLLSPVASDDPAGGRQEMRATRLLLAAGGPVLCVAAVAAHVHTGSRPLVVVLSAAAVLPLAVLAAAERRRRRAAPGGSRVLLWAVAPATLWWVVIVLGAAATGRPFDGTLGDVEAPLVAGDAGRALTTALVIGFGEEYLFRGLLLVLAIRARLTAVGYLAVGLSFGAWHLPDASDEGAVAMGVTFVAMTAVSQLVLVPLRLRSRTLAGPALLHAANNLALRLV
jgi:membrane protease YdiL (CAAX protease family)